MYWSRTDPQFWEARGIPRTGMVASVGLVIPILNEAGTLSSLFADLEAHGPDRQAILFVDGGSDDGSQALVEAAGYPLMHAHKRGRAAQINVGVEALDCEAICVLHADTKLPRDWAAKIMSVLRDPSVSLAGFRPVMTGKKLRWATSIHNFIKTWYAPLLFRPHLFIKGCRLLFGDHAMFFRRQDYLYVGGMDEELMVMEEADLCIKMCAIGRMRLLWHPVYSSDRRVGAWGGLRANLTYIALGVMWGLGFKKRLAVYYPDVR